MRSALLLITLALAGCGQRDARVDQRLTAIEQQLNRIEQQQVNQALIEDAHRNPPFVPSSPERSEPARARVTEAAPRYELIGLGGGRRTYPTLVRCEIARSALLEEWAAVNERVRRDANGRILHPPVSCVPL